MSNKTVLKIFWYYFEIIRYLSPFVYVIAMVFMIDSLIRINVSSVLIVGCSFVFVICAGLLFFVNYLFLRLIEIIIEHDKKLRSELKESDDTVK